MIRRLILENFKGIREANIELEPLSIFIGSNNSGKTSILEALYLVPNPARSVPYRFETGTNTALNVVHQMHETLDSYGYIFLMHGYNAKTMKIICETDGIEDIEWKFVEENNNIRIIQTIIDKPDRIIDENDVDLLIEELYTSRRNPKDFLTISANNDFVTCKEGTVIANALFINDDLLKNAYSYFREIWAKILNTDILRTVAEKASTLSNDKYSNFTIEPFLSNRLSFNAYFKNGKRIRMGDLGQGMQNYIVAQLLYAYDDYGTILWDDIEAHLNPKIIYELSMWFYKLIEQKKQVIISTHSLDVIKTMCGINEEQSAIYLTKLVDGKLEYKKMKYEEFEKYLDSGIDLRVSEGYVL